LLPRYCSCSSLFTQRTLILQIKPSDPTIQPLISYRGGLQFSLPPSTWSVVFTQRFYPCVGSDFALRFPTWNVLSYKNGLCPFRVSWLENHDLPLNGIYKVVSLLPLMRVLNHRLYDCYRRTTQKRRVWSRVADRLRWREVPLTAWPRALSSRWSIYRRMGLLAITQPFLHAGFPDGSREIHYRCCWPRSKLREGTPSVVPLSKMHFHVPGPPRRSLLLLAKPQLRGRYPRAQSNCWFGVFSLGIIWRQLLGGFSR
jgi:hypothetical protein